MLLQNEHDLVLLLGVIAALLLTLTIAAGVIASLKTFQVRQFQDLLFKAERKIESLERRMFSVLNAVPVALVETDNTGKFTFANKAAHQLLGRKDSELIGLRFHSATWGITFPDGRPVPPDMLPIARTLRGQTVKGFQHLLTNHGSHRKVMVSVTSMPIMNSAGEITGSTSAMVEIETSAGEGVDDVAGLWRGHWFAAATVPFWGLDAKGTVLDINDAALDMFDLKRDDALGRNWTQFFVADPDFQKAVDYLGDTQDETEPHNQKSLRLTLGVGESERAMVVTAWVVRTGEDGDIGLTVMALPVGALPAEGAQSPDPIIEPASALNDDDALELADLRTAEIARAALGVGTWQYDPDADAIVEDEGMMALIGREEPGGPTLISDADQARADTEFSRLMSGENSDMSMDIQVVRPDGNEHWITLKGQARVVDGERRIFGVALDTTPYRTGQPVVETAQAVDVDAIRTEARAAALAEAKAAHDAELAELKAAHEVELESVKADSAGVYARDDAAAAAPEPVVIREPDPAVAEENEALKAQVADLRAQLETTTTPDDNAALRDRVAALETALHDAETRRDDLQGQLDEIMFAKPVADPRDARIEELEAAAAAAQTEREQLQAQLDELANRPPVEPDYSAHEARIAALEEDVTRAEAERQDALGAAKLYLDTMRRAETERDTVKAELADLHTAGQEAAALRTRVAMLETSVQEMTALRARLRDLEQVAEEKAAVQAQLEEVLARPAPEPDTSEWEAKLADTRFELAKWQAAYHDVKEKLDDLQKVNAEALEQRVNDLQAALADTQTRQTELQNRLEQTNAALANAQKYETIGRLTGDVAQDFAQMLQVINGALEVLSRQNESPDSVRRLSQAALAAGKRGERLTRQLQAFQSEDF